MAASSNKNVSHSPTEESAKALANQLLEAELAFWMQQLTGKKFQAMLNTELDFLYEQLGSMTLRQAVSEEKVRATALRYAVDMEIGGGIPELFGEIAGLIFEFRANETTTLGDVVPEHIATEVIDKLFEPGSLVDHTVRNIRNSDAFRSFLAEIVFTVLKGYLLEKNTLMKMGTVASGTRMVRDWVSNKAPEFSESVEEKVRQFTESGVKNSLNILDEALGDEQYRQLAHDSALNLWDSVKNSPIARYRDYVSEQDLQEFMVMGYEFWLAFRESDYLKSCIDAGVGFFFHKYGEETLHTVLSEMGVTESMIVGELNTYLPDFAELLVKQGIAETILRRQLKRFYQSKSTLTILQQANQPAA